VNLAQPGFASLLSQTFSDHRISMGVASAGFWYFKVLSDEYLPGGVEESLQEVKGGVIDTVVSMVRSRPGGE
jgi:hypothetical protein